MNIYKHRFFLEDIDRNILLDVRDFLESHYTEGSLEEVCREHCSGDDCGKGTECIAVTARRMTSRYNNLLKHLINFPECDFPEEE